MPVEFIGARPNVTLHRGEATAGFVSLWEAEWSVRGPGIVILAWVDGDPSVRLLTPEFRLGMWIVDTFARHIPELDALPPIGAPVGCEIREWRITSEHVRVKVTGEDGTRVAASIGQPLATRPGHVTNWEIGSARWTLTNLVTFCTDAMLEIDDARVLGRAVVSEDGDHPTSSALIATHETWIRH